MTTLWNPSGRGALCPAALLCGVLALPLAAVAQDAPDTMGAGPILHSQPQPKSAAGPETPAPPAESPAPAPPVPTPVYDKSIFDSPLPAAQLAFLKTYDGARTRDLYRDKQFKALRKAALPNWMFHYGRDVTVDEAFDLALSASNEAVTVRAGRYVTLAGGVSGFIRNDGRALIWIDMQDGVALAAFFFHPTNGEPTPTVTVFSRQIAADSLSIAQLPPEFFTDFSQWAAEERVPPITTRYFIGAVNERILLAHDEDFCSATFSRVGDDCLQMTAEAADVDMNTAYYLEQVHYATNATAWMIVGADQRSFVELRDSRCGGVADPLGCRIRITREHVRVISRPPVRARR